jgi:hypothetical protein
LRRQEAAIMNENMNPRRLARAVASRHLADTLSYGLPIAELIGLVAVDVARARDRATTDELLVLYTTLMERQPTAEARTLLDAFESCRTTELLSHEEAAYLVGLAIGAAVRGQP